MCLKRIVEIFKPSVRKERSGDEIYQIIRKACPTADHIYISDSTYWLCSQADITQFLALDLTNKEPYVKQEFDCDDFSYRLMGQLSTPEWAGIAFGIIWTNLHAMNCFIDDTGKFWFVEPQTDALKDTLDAWQGNEELFVMM